MNRGKKKNKAVRRLFQSPTLGTAVGNITSPAPIPPLVTAKSPAVGDYVPGITTDAPPTHFLPYTPRASGDLQTIPHNISMVDATPMTTQVSVPSSLWVRAAQSTPFQSNLGIKAPRRRLILTSSSYGDDGYVLDPTSQKGGWISPQVPEPPHYSLLPAIRHFSKPPRRRKNAVVKATHNGGIGYF